MTARITAAQARALGIDTKTKKRTTRKEAGGPYHTRCKTCGEEFRTQAAEDRHLKERFEGYPPRHGRYELML